MSLFDRRLLVLSLASLGGCGFRPLYGGGTESGPGAILGKVRVIAGRGELPFRLREALIENLRPAQADAPLTLTVKAKVTRDGLLIEDDDEITRFNLTLEADYALVQARAAEDVADKMTRRLAAAYDPSWLA